MDPGLGARRGGIEVRGHVDGDDGAPEFGLPPVADESGDVRGQPASTAGAEDAVEDEPGAGEFGERGGPLGRVLPAVEVDDVGAGAHRRGEPVAVGGAEEDDDADTGTQAGQRRRGVKGVTGVVAGACEHADPGSGDESAPSAEDLGAEAGQRRGGTGHEGCARLEQGHLGVAHGPAGVRVGRHRMLLPAWSVLPGQCCVVSAAWSVLMVGAHSRASRSSRRAARWARKSA
ncbi:Uncharacterised protein [Mycobacteroides abscessus subsp. abscessus]|nr:Uncharacterised protein [Mycobacteroides abscessus subsp. abscessus]